MEKDPNEVVNEGPQKPKDKEKLGETGEIQEERPIDFIRRMNPGRFIPTGEELAKMLRERENELEKDKEE